MTALVIIAGLLPIMWRHGAGAGVMKRIAAPMIGGVVSSVLMKLLVYLPCDLSLVEEAGPFRSPRRITQQRRSARMASNKMLPEAFLQRPFYLRNNLAAPFTMV